MHASCHSPSNPSNPRGSRVPILTSNSKSCLRHANARAHLLRNPFPPREASDACFSKQREALPLAPSPLGGRGRRACGSRVRGELGWMAEIRSQNPTPPPADTACPHPPPLRRGRGKTTAEYRAVSLPTKRNEHSSFLKATRSGAICQATHRTSKGSRVAADTRTLVRIYCAIHSRLEKQAMLASPSNAKRCRWPPHTF